MYRGILWLALAIVVAVAQGASASTLVSKKCNQAGAPLYSSDFHWGYELVDMLTRFAEIYVSPKRLERHAYVDAKSGQIKLPYDTARGGDVVLPESFVASVRAHIENALRLEYIDAVFFPDLGHSHFLVPQKKWDDQYNEIPSGEISRLYTEMMSDTDLKVLYHTAEQLHFLNENKELEKDRRTQERFYSRNLVGDNRGEGRLELLQNRPHMMNTVGEVPGYFWYGAGFNVSANENGCFGYNDRGIQRYFDLSLYDLEPDPTKLEDDEHP